MSVASIFGPLDRLEHAIETGTLWEEGDTPIEITGFDAREDVLSLILENTDLQPALTVEKDEKSNVTRLNINGKPAVELIESPTGFALSDVAITLAGSEADALANAPQTRLLASQETPERLP